ncbi:DEAD/DEAH box helicase [Luteitalea sp. TBR-22]|uniref:DEAD/DEAH box helicase n=1 Tax=Luteitalea sp. TBR-22 TaxID=2802971 RepID=UPI001AFB1174|nr:DEAD/DEAH box helicase [Luteitalea sp. TBR-22]BCS31431.1 DEAD/DEAH box helicase [Luteitalea sp. TBR-22]
MVIVNEIARTLEDAGFAVTDRVTLPARAATYAPVPAGLAAPLATRLAADYPKGLYRHQSEALAASAGGEDVCLATPTASGKSLVFMAAAADACLEDKSARVLALYPAKALIQDQLEKWKAFLGPLGISVGFIDGSVPVKQRDAILIASRVVAMTPDVAHAWLMSHLTTTPVSAFLSRLQLAILDEAHVYDGVFGTNMAYFLRRLDASSRAHRVISSTATIGEPAAFMQQLTGREMRVVDGTVDGSGASAKTLLLAPSVGKDAFDRTVTLLAKLAETGAGRFLAFGDSRKAVERIVAAVLRQRKGKPAIAADDEDDDDIEPEVASALQHVLPYRAGYEAEDRARIQQALSTGELSGVVSTSALELGIDIGDLDIVVLMNTPPSVKAFRQRIGRAGRRREAVCILLDDREVMAPLATYVAREPEPSWLYLENRFIQYAHALCAASETQATGRAIVDADGMDSLPRAFRRLVINELQPTEGIAPDLYPLKQQAQDCPHYEFPIRSAGEQSLNIVGPFDKPLGSVSYSQMLREAYPGAVYYYMARPYRVTSVDLRTREIRTKSSRYVTTRPITETMAFPDMLNGVLQAWTMDAGYVCETELQVSQRVKGFTEQRGSQKHTFEYGPLSPHAQRPLNRFFRTTGVAWTFQGVARSEAIAEAILQAFCVVCGVHDRDLGYAYFKAETTPFMSGPSVGTVIFDATNGSLRLTERLAERFAEVVSVAAEAAQDPAVRQDLTTLLRAVTDLAPRSLATAGTPASSDEWTVLIARGTTAMHAHAKSGLIEVTVKDYRYTPQGLLYELEPLRATVRRDQDGELVEVPKGKWLVPAGSVQAINGQTRLMRVNLVTGEEETSTSIDSAA